MIFWRRFQGTIKLAVLSQFEYRLNLFFDAIAQPVVSSLVEMAMWYAIFSATDKAAIGGFGREYYLVYALWATFFSRVAANWMYEFRMIEEIETGRVNAILLRPISFYEFYLGQYIGYKGLTSILSFCIPLLISALIPSPVQVSRFPLALLLLCFYVVMVHTFSFAIASLNFFFTRLHSVTVAKNLTIWILSGEMIPIDLIPDPYKSVLLWLPFPSGVFIPVGYLTGRIGIDMIWQGFVSVAIGIIFFGIIGFILWNQGRKVYSGTGA